MSNTAEYRVPKSQKILRVLSFLSLFYIAFALFVFGRASGIPEMGLHVNSSMVITAFGLGSLFVIVAVKQLFAQKRRLVIAAISAAITCNILQLALMKNIESKLFVWAEKSAVADLFLLDPVFPIEAILLASLPWYLALIFPVIANFRKLPDPHPA